MLQDFGTASPLNPKFKKLILVMKFQQSVDAFSTAVFVISQGISLFQKKPLNVNFQQVGHSHRLNA